MPEWLKVVLAFLTDLKYKAVNLSVEGMCLLKSWRIYALFGINLCLFFANSLLAQAEDDIPKLQNPVTVEYLQKHLRKNQPRLVLNDSLENHLKERLKVDAVVQNMYRAVQMNADQVFSQPLLKRKLTGRRLLSISREMLYRINMLGMTYRIEKERSTLERINEELMAVCKFSDWNPSHYLDVAEMSMAVALALDWTSGDLPETTIDMAETALIEKGIMPSWPANGKAPGWANGTNNWNQVCNGGMIAAAISIADKNPELAAKTIHRALEGLPHALVEYGPDGVYPEGSTYWGYGTDFTVATIAMLESAFSTDFGMGDYPGFMESAVFRALSIAPSGMYYNFADCGDRRKPNGDIILAWFAARTGNVTFFEEERFLRPLDEMGRLYRLAGAGLVWLAQFKESHEEPLPTAWKGDGANPVVIFTGGSDDKNQYYFGGKGGRGMVNHGNMDGGSFIFELHGVRWVIDLGNQPYHTLEKTGFKLWGRCQDCERWTLLTKNNFGHSTISIDNQLHRSDGLVTLASFKKGDKPAATFDMTATLGNVVSKSFRTFIKDSQSSILIQDDIKISEATEMIVWQLITQADVEITDGGTFLRQNGKALKLENLSHPDHTISIVSLYPAPLKIDRQIENLKRLEIRIPAGDVKESECHISVRLAGM
jgi:hypothetical protein